MGAHNQTTEHYARKRAKYVMEGLRNSTTPASQFWANEIEHALNQPVGGSLKKYMLENSGDTVQTLQAVVHLSGADPVRISNLWAPPSRKVDTSRSTYVLLDGSRRDYSGMVTLCSGDGRWIGFTEYGENVQLVVYSAGE